MHRVRGWIHRRPAPELEAKVIAVQHAVSNARVGGRPVLTLDEKTAHPVRTPVRADTRAADGTVRREFEYVRKGNVSWYGVQECATGTVAMIRSRSRMDSAAFIEIVEHLKGVHGPAGWASQHRGPVDA